MKTKEKKRVYTVTDKELERYRRQGYEQAVRLMMHTLFGLTYLMLRDEFHFGKSRMRRALTKLAVLADDLCHDYFSLEDVIEVLKDEVGIDITEKTIYVKNE